MRLVVDTNILFSYFWKGSMTRDLLMTPGLELFSPEFALEEINNHVSEIKNKTGLTSSTFATMKADLAIKVVFVPISHYKRFLRRAMDISPDPNDTDFFALALAIPAPVWSNDRRMKSQDVVRIFSTKDLLDDPAFVDLLTD